MVSRSTIQTTETEIKFVFTLLLNCLKMKMLRFLKYKGLFACTSLVKIVANEKKNNKVPTMPSKMDARNFELI